MSLTPDEIALVNKLGQCFGDFERLEPVHPADEGDFVFHIHALQNIVMSRSAVRDHPDDFPHLPGVQHEG